MGICVEVKVFMSESILRVEMVNYCVCASCAYSSLTGHRVHHFPGSKVLRFVTALFDHNRPLLTVV